MDVLEIKRQVRERDGGCTECGMTSEESLEEYGCDLDVHRVQPGSKYTLEGCVTLCKACHGPKPKTPKGGPAPYGWLVRLPEEMKKVVKTLTTRTRRTITTEVVIALEEYLAKQGLWPPEQEENS